jgi:hypothetical protein
VEGEGEVDRLEPRRDCEAFGLMMGLGPVVGLVQDSWVLALVFHLVRAVLSYA